MQADEEVGKIATSTPVLVAKALECLMEDVLKSAAMVAAGRNSKTVQPAHLKQCIADDDQFDFLRPTVASVPSLDDPANIQRQIAASEYYRRGEQKEERHRNSSPVDAPCFTAPTPQQTNARRRRR